MPGLSHVLRISGVAALAIQLLSCSGQLAPHSLAIEPTPPTVAAGTLVSLRALGTYPNGFVVDLTQSVDWASSDEAVATVTGGTATTRAEGVAIVSAVDPATGLAAEGLVVVGPAELATLELTPPQPQIAAGTTVALQAPGTLTEGSVIDMTHHVVWSSSSQLVANVAAGEATGTSAGVSVIGAADASSGLTAETLLTVTPAYLATLELSPPAPSIALGTDIALSATGVFSDATTQAMTDEVAWSAVDNSITTVSDQVGTRGLASGNAVGSTSIIALHAESGVIGTALLTVTAAELVALEVTPPLMTLAAGTSGAFTATGVYTDASTQDLTASVAWGTDVPEVATVSSAPGTTGLATAAGIGVTEVTVIDLASGISTNATLTVTAAELVSIGTTPSDPTIPLGMTQAFVATGTFTDGSDQDLTDAVTWSSNDDGISTISNAAGSEGLASSAALGTSTITARDVDSGIEGSTSLTISPAILESISISPVAPSIALGTDQNFAATGHYTDASTQDLTGTVTWASSDTVVATISNAVSSEGLAAGVALGVTTITATEPGSMVTGTTSLAVTAAELASIQVTPTGYSVATGESLQFTATGTYTDSSNQDVTDAVTWSSASGVVASVSNAGGTEGLATGLSVGTTALTATDAASGIDDDATVHVVAEITYRSSASASNTGAGDLTVATPAGVAAGDTLIAAIAFRPSFATIATPAGWNLVRQTDNGTGNTNSLATYRRLVVAGEPASHTWDLSGVNASAGGIAAFVAVDSASSIDVEDGQTTATSLTHSTPDITTSRTDTMLVAGHSFASSSSWTPPMGMAKAADVASHSIGTPGGISVAISYGLQTAAGATGAQDATASANSDVGNAHLVALSPGP